MCYNILFNDAFYTKVRTTWSCWSLRVREKPISNARHSHTTRMFTVYLPYNTFWNALQPNIIRTRKSCSCELGFYKSCKIVYYIIYLYIFMAIKGFVGIYQGTFSSSINLFLLYNILYVSVYKYCIYLLI